MVKLKTLGSNSSANERCTWFGSSGGARRHQRSLKRKRCALATVEALIQRRLMWRRELTVMRPHSTMSDTESSVKAAAFQLAWRTSAALALVAAVTSAASFTFWKVFERDPPMTVGNMRGTALTVFALAVPLQVASMAVARRGSSRAVFVWLGCLGYMAYNAVMFCFAVRFNSFFLPSVAFLGLAFWALLTLLRSLDIRRFEHACARVPARSVSIYLMLSAAAFALLWLSAIVPATIENSMPEVLVQSGFNQNPVWVLDFAFTFPLMTLGSIWLWRRRAWGYVISGMMVVMLTLETAGIAVDQAFGHLHDPAAPLAAVPAMIGFTLVGLVFSILFLRRVNADPTRRLNALDQ